MIYDENCRRVSPKKKRTEELDMAASDDDKSDSEIEDFEQQTTSRVKRVKSQISIYEKGQD